MTDEEKKDWEVLVECCARAEENLFRDNLPDGTDDEWRNAILGVGGELKRLMEAVEWITSGDADLTDRMKFYAELRRRVRVGEREN